MYQRKVAEEDATESVKESNQDWMGTGQEVQGMYKNNGKS